MNGAVLVVAPAWIGDLVMAEPLLRLLGERQGAPPVDLLVPPYLAPLAARLPGVSRVHELAVAHGELALGKRWRIGRTLRAAGYAQAIVLPNSLKSALVPWFARIPRRSGWRGEWRHGLLNDLRHPRAQPQRQVDRFTVLGHAAGTRAEEKPEGVPRLQARPATALRQRLGLVDQRPVLALCAGAEYGPAKRWPGAHFAAVAAAAATEGMQVWLLGGAGDAPLTCAIRERVAASQREHVYDLAGRTDTGEVVDLLACAAAVLSNDTGLMHVAAALGRPLVVIYGSSSPEFTPPLCDGAVVLRSSIACAPCRARQCRFGHYRCLADHSPERVLQVLRGSARVP